MPQINRMTAHMKPIPAIAGCALVAFAAHAVASPQAVLSGQWKNLKGSVVVRLGPCGNAICGVVIDASALANETARNGGTPNLIGTRILSGLHAAADGSFKGQAFDPKRNIHGAATVRMIGRDALEVRGCAAWGLVCKAQRWTRIG